MKVNVKFTLLTSSIAFVLSLFTALIAKAGFGRSFIRALIIALIFGAIAVGIDFVKAKFFSDSTSDTGSSSVDSDDSKDNPAPIGNKVDITIDDAELQDDENSPRFVLTGQNQMLNKDDLSGKSSAQIDNINLQPEHSAVESVPKVVPSTNKTEPVSNESVQNPSPSFKPVTLGKAPDNDTDELPAIETSLGDGSFLKQEDDINEDALDVLPDMEGGGKLRDDTVTDSEFASSGKTSRLSDPIFPDGSMAESKDAALMAEALRTVLKKGD